MKKTALTIFLILIISVSAFAVEGNTVTAAAAATTTAPEAVTTTAAEAVTAAAKDETVFDFIGGLFAPSKPKNVSETSKDSAQAMTISAETAEKPGEELFTMPGKLLIIGNIFSLSVCTVSWIDFFDNLNFYEEAYADSNNTTIENYNSLVSMRTDIINRETTAWVITGIASALLIYTVTDILWLHAAFPVKPVYTLRENTHILALNYGF